jgi:hypothetical protein
MAGKAAGAVTISVTAVTAAPHLDRLRPAGPAGFR